MNRFVLSLLLLIFLQLSSIATTEPLKYNFESTKRIPINLSITKEISTKENLKYGQELEFVVQNDVIYNGKTILNSSDKVNAKIGSIVTSGMNGFPAEITIDDFDFSTIKDSQLLSSYTKYGMNRSVWVYPLKWALTPIPFVGSLTNLIKGGHARIKPTEVITVYYYPEWK